MQDTEKLRSLLSNPKIPSHPIPAKLQRYNMTVGSMLPICPKRNRVHADRRIRAD